MRILLIITGGIAAYKSFDVIRQLRQKGHDIHVILTEAAQSFVTPLSCGALSENPVHHALFDINEEAKIGHIALARLPDLVLVCPATAHFIQKMAHGVADDLATTVLLATDAPILVAPAMNPNMFQHKATQRNLRQLCEDGCHILTPDEGLMACGETGRGKLPLVQNIVSFVEEFSAEKPLQGLTAIVTAGPTHEPLDPVRYITNRSSGKQGFAIAASLGRLGANVTLITGPVQLPTPGQVQRVDVLTAADMYEAVTQRIPCDIAIFCAAVADWRPVSFSAKKIKKTSPNTSTSICLTENPDILATVSHLPETTRPRLVIGFAAETEDIEQHASDKWKRKGCDWLVANDVSGQDMDVFGEDHNKVTLYRHHHAQEHTDWLNKNDIASWLSNHILEWHRND